jgi:putative (di)nucleoside polyphosphate hydrolase
MEDEKLLLAEYQFFTDSFWKNEEVGEKRVDFFITLTTAIIAGIVALITSEHANLSDAEVHQIATAALSGTFLFGLITFLRILQRNRVTDEYKEIVGYLRRQLKMRSLNLSEYDLPFKSQKRVLRGGLAETVALMNSIIFAVIVALWLGRGWGWLAIPISLLILFIFQVGVARKDRQKKEAHSQTFRAGVGAIISNTSGKVLALERKDIPGQWQLPQGGLEIGESPLEAVKREILEETGIKESKLQLVSTESKLLVYELPKEKQSPKTGLGQVQRWFLFRYDGSDKAITLGDKEEFRDWKWVSMNEMVSSAVPFKLSVYQELAEYFSDQLNKTI